jgi:hypothetical protein
MVLNSHGKYKELEVLVPRLVRKSGYSNIAIHRFVVDGASLASKTSKYTPLCQLVSNLLSCLLKGPEEIFNLPASRHIDVMTRETTSSSVGNFLAIAVPGLLSCIVTKIMAA